MVLLLVFAGAWPVPAQPSGDAAHDLARRISAAAAGQTAALSFRNQSSLAAAAFDRIRTVIEGDLRASGVRLADTSTEAVIRVTASESFREYLLTAEIFRGEQRTVELVSWPRLAVSPRPAAGIATLEKKLIVEQDEPILDFAVAETDAGSLLLVLEPGRVAVYSASPAGWAPLRDFPIAAAGPLLRDPRGRLTVQAPAFQAYLPGVACRGTMDPPALDCTAGDALWPLASGASFLGLAAFSSGRNYFNGELMSPAGNRNTVPPFFSMALAGAGAEPLWILAGLDGRAALYNSSFTPAGPAISGWGSGLAGTEANCGGGRQVLSTRPGDASEPDALEAWELSGGEPVAASPPLDFPGPVTALWPAGATAASAVARDPRTGRYAAYSVVIRCGS